MAGEWKRFAFADAIDLISGGTPKTSIPDYWGGSIPWLSVGDFNTGYRWINAAEKSITERGLSESATAVLNQRDIIISARGTVGVLAQLARPMAFNQSCYGIRGKSGIAETDFIYYALQRAVSGMRQVAHGGVFDTITRDTFKIIEVDLPPLPEQRAIAHILGTLDDKIELNRRMNETLEAIVQAIFKSWFVDFDPVRAKAEGRDLAGMDAETAGLFPDSFQDSALGKIPKAWRVGTLGEICEIALGGDWGEDQFFEGAVEVVCLRGVDLEHIRSQGSANPPHRWIKQLSLEKRRIFDQDVLVAASGIGPIGRSLWVAPGLEKQFGLPVVYSNFCKRLTAKSRACAIYADRLLFQMREFGETKEYITGTSVPNLDMNGLLSRRLVLLPSEDVLRAFANAVGPIVARLYSMESRSLAALRDALLPKLLSGEIRMGNAETFARIPLE